MPRWEAGADTRLVQAAYELSVERGFEEVTVAQIAARAGLTKRTFFRYFTDKREVLFSGSADFQASVVSGVISAPEDVSPIDAVVAALAAAGAELTSLGEGVRQRQQLIDSSTDLQEREMIKVATLTSAIGDALRHRKVRLPAANLTAQAGMAIFKTAFDSWIRAERPLTFPALMYETLNELRSAVSPAIVG